jgi:hypothetical protein
MKAGVIIFSMLTFLSAGCVTQFIPETDEDKDLLVVEGLITNKRGINTVKLSKTLPLASKNTTRPAKGYTVTISDDIGNAYTLTESSAGTYTTDSAVFQGVPGRTYQLTVKSNEKVGPNFTYRSVPVEMKPVPEIDSLYYEKIELEGEYFRKHDACQIYLDTHDPENNCRFYRWNFTETWEFHIPFPVTNKVCWMTNNSDVINVKSTFLLSEDKVTRYPLLYIPATTDRLSVKYSVLVNQYSLNEDEFDYWSKLQNITEEIGSLYDITPATIPGNIFCVEDPGQTVLGYFSVSSCSSKRIFIKEKFKGLANLYSDCISDTVRTLRGIQGLNSYIWVLEDHGMEIPSFYVLTDKEGCVDCRVRGSAVKPSWWDEYK